MRHQYKNNIKVGIFILSSLLLLFAYIMLLGDKKTYFNFASTYKINFHTIHGLFKGSIVTINGIAAGNVTDIIFVQKTGNIEVVISILQKFIPVINKQSVAHLTRKGLLGDKYISIITYGEQGLPLPDGSYIPTTPDLGIFEILNKKETGKQISSILSELSFFIKDLNTQNTIQHASLIFSKENAKNLSQILQKLNNILTKIDEGEGTAGALINNKDLYHRILSLLGKRHYSKYLPKLLNNKK